MPRSRWSATESDAFLGLWLLTIALGGSFLFGTAQEWHRLIYEHGLTISTNLFGTTYYSLVGLHAFHVTAGLIMLSIVAIFGFGRPRGRGAVTPRRSALDVLALCRCRVGRGFHRGLRSGTLRDEMATLPTTEQMSESPRAPREIEVPAPTAWPSFWRLDSHLLFAGLVTSASVSVLGAVLALAGCVGWFREVFPHEHEEVVPVVPEDIRITTERRVVERLPVAGSGARVASCSHLSDIGGCEGRIGGQRRHGRIGLCLRRAEGRKHLVSHQSSGRSRLRGIAEARACTAVFISCRQLRDCFGSARRCVTLVGLLYGAMLPMFARRPIVLGGLIAPVLWSGLLYTMLGLLNPLLASHIDWLWFMASQVAFGIVAGLVVVRQPRMPTRENLSFAIRAGIEAPGMTPPRENGEERP